MIDVLVNQMADGEARKWIFYTLVIADTAKSIQNDST